MIGVQQDRLDASASSQWYDGGSIGDVYRIAEASRYSKIIYKNGERAMRITQEELMNRLKNPNNLVNKLGKVPNGAESNTSRRGNDSENRNNAGRAPEIPNAPPSIRVIAGVLANAEGNAAQVARNLNLTPGQVLYAEKSNSSVKKVTEKQVEEMALTRLMDALGLLDVDTISGEKPKDISTIAANLSRVHTNLKPKDGFGGNGVNITIYSPKLRSIDDYESIDVRTGT